MVAGVYGSVAKTGNGGTFARDHLAECAMVLSLCFELSRSRRDDAGEERGVEVDHSTINRWVLKYAPELDKRIRPHLKSTNDSWQVDKTYIKIKSLWKYLHRAVGSQGNTLDFMLSAKRPKSA